MRTLFQISAHGANASPSSSIRPIVTNWFPLATIPGYGAEKFVADTNAIAVHRFYRVRIGE
jgi:hypothetical protein